MPSIAPHVRQRLLCRSDLDAMSVEEQRIAGWLWAGQLEQVGNAVAGDGGSDAVYAVHTESLRDELQQLLAQHGRDEVAFGSDEVKQLLAEPTAESAAATSTESVSEVTQDVVADAQPTEPQPTAEDVLTEHVVEAELDDAIEDITAAIDSLMESSMHSEQDLRDDAPFAAGIDELEVAAEQIEDAAARIEDEAAAEDGDILVEGELNLGDESSIEAEAPAVEIAADVAQESEPVAEGDASEVAVEPEPELEPSAAEPVVADPVAQEEIDAITAPAVQPNDAQSGAVPTPIEVRATVDISALAEPLQQIQLAILTLAERRVEPTDLSPIVGALANGVRSLQESIDKAAGCESRDERLERIAKSVEDVTAAIATLREAMPTERVVHVGGVAHATDEVDVERTERIATWFAAGSAIAGWLAAMWLHGTDPKLAIAVVVCANLVSCAALVSRRSAR
jgi:hypothetical protein